MTAMTRLLAAGCVLSVTLAGLASAAPSVSSIAGDTSHGEALTITGSGFGSKATAAPIRWETFEDGTVGQSVTTTGYWSAKSPSQTLFDDDTHIPLRDSWSTRQIRWHGLGYGITGGPTMSFYRENIGFANTGKAYVNLWVYMDFISGDPESSQGWQLKLFRIHGDMNHSSRPSFVNNLFTLDAESVQYWPVAVIDVGGLYGPGGGWMKEHYWVNMVMEYKDSSTVGSADGQAHFYTSASPLSSGSYFKHSLTDCVTRSGDVTGWVNCLSMGYLLVNGGDEANTYWDDVYIDNSWARVEIGDASIYANCTHREMQIPSAWSTGSITVTVNQGSFANSTPAYLYVVDEDGNVNATGYPITIGGPIMYNLSVTNGTGDGQYEAGAVVAISADPAPSGKAFGIWVGDSATVADLHAASTTVTMPTADVSLTAGYVWIYQLTVNNGTGDGSYTSGTVVDISADPAASGQAFDAWTGDVANVADTLAADTTITMPPAAVEVTATYKAASTLAGDLDGDGFVGQDDLDIVLDQWGCGDPPADPITDGRADPSGDGFVGQDDLDIVLDHWGEGT